LLKGPAYRTQLDDLRPSAECYENAHLFFLFCGDFVAVVFLVILLMMFLMIFLG